MTKQHESLMTLDDYSMRAIIIQDSDSTAWTPPCLEVRVWGAYNFAAVDLIDGQTGEAVFDVVITIEDGVPKVVVAEIDENRHHIRELAKLSLQKTTRTSE